MNNIHEHIKNTLTVTHTLKERTQKVDDILLAIEYHGICSGCFEGNSWMFLKNNLINNTFLYHNKV